MLSKLRWVLEITDNLGWPVVTLLIVMMIVTASAIPWTGQHLIWALESDRIVEEVEDPVAVEYLPGSEAPVPRASWVGGQSVYIQRSICLYKIPTGGHERRWLTDTVRLDFEAVPLSSELYPPYGGGDKALPLPWCGKRVSIFTLPAAALAPGPITFKAEIHARINDVKNDVIIQRRPLTLMISTTPVREELASVRELTKDLRAKLTLVDTRLVLINARLALLDTRLRSADQILERLGSYQSLLDPYLRERGILPPTKGAR